jgi:hypothetical protein
MQEAIKHGGELAMLLSSELSLDASGAAGLG